MVWSRQVLGVWLVVVGIGMGVLAGRSTISLPRSDGLVELASQSSTGMPGNGVSVNPAVSADGNYVAFDSQANNLIPNDFNSTTDVFVRDRMTGITTCVSVSSNGTLANGYSYAPSISADGRLIAFSSQASSLVAGDTNNDWDVFVHDRLTGQTNRVSLASDGAEGNNSSVSATIAAEGHFLTFESDASNLVPGDSNQRRDVFVRALDGAATSRVSVATDGSQGNGYSGRPAISADGTKVAFESDADNLSNDPDINHFRDIFVHDLLTGVTQHVSVDSSGVQANGESGRPAISADGRYVAFESSASNLLGAADTNGATDIFVYDLTTGVIVRVSVTSQGGEAWGLSGGAAISTNGRYVSFWSHAPNLAEPMTPIPQAYRHDRQTGITLRVSVTPDGTPGDGLSSSSDTALAGDGSLVAFSSNAALLPGVGGTIHVYGYVAFSPVSTPTPTTTPTSPPPTHTPTPTPLVAAERVLLPVVKR